MKSLIINIIFIFFSSVAISQNNCDTLFCDSCLIYNPFIVKLKHINPNFNGSDSSYFLSSIDGKTKLKIIRDYKNGVLVHAIAKYNNDQIYEENYYNNGLNGIMRTFDTDGKLAGWSRWENGKAISSFQFYSNGNFHFVSLCDTLLANSKFMVEYYCDGKIKEIHVPVDSSGATYSILYDKKGNRILEHIYNGGVREFKSYFENGSISSKGFINNMFPFFVGEWQSFYVSGKKKMEGKYDNFSRKIGKWITWDENGKIIKEEYY